MSTPITWMGRKSGHWAVWVFIVLVGWALGGNGFGASVTVASESRVAHAINPGCVNLILGGDFEQFSPAWQIQASSRPPAYSTQQAFSGIQSLRVGNGLELPDVEGISEVRHQPILLPYDATSIILRFVYWPFYESAPGLTDLQQADLFDANTGQLILPLLNVQDNKREWKAVDYDLTPYAGREVSLRFRAHNDGQPGRTLMYVDNVEIEYCATTPIPTYTPSQTPVTTATVPPTWTALTPVATLTPTGATVTLSPTPSDVPTTGTPPITISPTSLPVTPGVIPTLDPTCVNIINDYGFERWGGWHFGKDPVPGQYVSDVRYADTYAVLLGNPPGYQANVKTFSSIRQLVTIPYDATHAELRWWHWLRTEEAGQPTRLTDRQDLVFLDTALNPIEIPMRELRNQNGWQENYRNLDRYRGRTFYVYFNAFNDGDGVRTWMYLDNVQLYVCGSGLRGGQYNGISTPVAIPLTPLATYTQLAVPTPSPLPSLTLPTAEFTPSTAAQDQPAPETSTPETILTVPVLTSAVEPTATTNVYALPTPTASFLVETETPSVVPSESGITIQPATEQAPGVVIVTPAPATERPLWRDRLGPISVLLGVLVLIGFIVWAILQTFRTNQP